MTIVFKAFAASPIADAGVLVMRLRARAVDTDQTSGLDFGGAALVLGASGGDEHAGGLEINIPDNGAAKQILAAGGMDGGVTSDAGRAVMSLRSAGYDIGPGEDVGGVAVSLDARGYEAPPVRAYGSLIAPAPAMLGYGGLSYAIASDDLRAGAAQSLREIRGILDRVSINALPRGGFSGLVRVADQIELGDALSVVYRELLVEGFDVAASPEYNFTAVARVVDALRLSGAVGSQLEATNAVAAAIAMGSLLDSWYALDASDSVAVAAELNDALTAGAALVERILAAGALDAGVVLGVVVRDSVDLAGAAGTALDASVALREAVGFSLRLTSDAGDFVAYSINTEGRGLSRYRNYPFNSFARIGDAYYGMTPDGIRRIEGDSDAGANIGARFRMALTNLGTTHMKRMLAAYLGYTASGALRLKTITVGTDGQKQANYYRLEAQPAVAPREARIKIGQGLRSVYWGFELEAIDGAAFSIDLLRLEPIVVEQSIQGQGGGKR